MTSATSATSIHKPARRGFTLVELLVVIGIIVVLIGILLPVIGRTMRQANRTRVASDLNGIATALAAYKTDFGDYPRIIYTGTAPYGIGSGASVLGKALLSPGDTTTGLYSASTAYYAGQFVIDSNGLEWAALQSSTGQTPAYGSPYWTPLPISAADGAPGPGFRVRGTVGAVHLPYLNADKFKTRGLAIVDYFGNPILYYAANPAHPVITTDDTTDTFGAGNSYVGTPNGVTPDSSVAPPKAPCPSLYNYSDNDTVALNATNSSNDYIPTFPDIRVMEAMLGIYDFNTYSGYLGPGETAASTAPFLLWSAGPDGQYGPVGPTSSAVSNFKSLQPNDVKKLVNNCDDVTNFTFGQ